jgi:outer membrane protein OmpA-like peptidoglycan-associated protein
MVAGVALAGAGCHGPNRDQTATQLHLSHMDQARANYGQHLDDMVDNAILHDMSLADHHFVPHSSEISGTGVRRLDRMAHLLSTYGGTVHYQTDAANADLVNRRLEHVKEYLTVAGCDMDRVNIKAGMGTGRLNPAGKAMEIEARGPVQPESSTIAGFTASPTGR